MNSKLCPVAFVLLLLFAACDGPGGRDPGAHGAPGRDLDVGAPYVPQDVPEDRTP